MGREELIRAQGKYGSAELWEVKTNREKWLKKIDKNGVDLIHHGNITARSLLNWIVHYCMQQNIYNMTSVFNLQTNDANIFFFNKSVKMIHWVESQTHPFK